MDIKIRGNFWWSICFLSALGWLAGCGEQLGEGQHTAASELFQRSGTRWPGPTFQPLTEIPVCWMNPSTDTVQTSRRQVVREAAEGSWQRFSSVTFTGWGTCGATFTGIGIQIADVQPQTISSNAGINFPVGVQLNGVPNGMTLNLSFKAWGVACQGHETGCIQYYAIHEFGHALGYFHEMERTDTPPACNANPLGSALADNPLGPYDGVSIMNYCNPALGGSTTVYNGNSLSEGDINGNMIVYGPRYEPWHGSTWSGSYANSRGWSGTFLRTMADVTNDGFPDLIGFNTNGVLVAVNRGTPTLPNQGFNFPFLATAEYGCNASWCINGGNTYPRYLKDMNGDGRADIVGFSYYGVSIALARTDNQGFLPSQMVLSNQYGAGQGWTSTDTYPRFLADVTGDGRNDIVGFGGSAVSVAVANSTGITFAPPINWLTGNFTLAQGWTNQAIYPRLLGDIDGDGWADIVAFGTSGVSVARSTGAGFAPPVFVAATFGTNQGWTDNSVYPRMLADVDGNNRLDIVGFGSGGVSVIRSLGLNASAVPTFAASTTWSPNYGTSQGWINQTAYPRYMVDVDGDHAVDVVGFGSAGTYVSFSNGSNAFGAPYFVADNLAANQGWTTIDTPRLVADVNHDGFMDFVGFGELGVTIVPW